MRLKILASMALPFALLFGLATALAACGEESEGAFCGGMAGEVCLESEYCDFVSTRCGVEDAGGTCRPRPDACLDTIARVIGSDGVIYDNACHAHAAGVDDCGPAPD